MRSNETSRKGSLRRGIGTKWQLQPDSEGNFGIYDHVPTHKYCHGWSFLLLEISFSSSMHMARPQVALGVHVNATRSRLMVNGCSKFPITRERIWSEAFNRRMLSSILRRSDTYELRVNYPLRTRCYQSYHASSALTVRLWKRSHHYGPFLTVFLASNIGAVLRSGVHRSNIPSRSNT